MTEEQKTMIWGVLLVLACVLASAPLWWPLVVHHFKVIEEFYGF